MAYYEIESGVTSTGLSLNNDSMYISNGGVASSTTAEEYSNIYVSEGGLAKDTTLNSGGGLIVSEGGAANRATVNSSGFLYVYESGSANSVTVNPGGHLFFYEGGTATEIIENGGYVAWSNGASVTFKPNAFSGVVIESYGTATVHSGTTANNTTVSSGYLYVYSGGTANGATVNSYGYASVFSGGTLNGATVNSGGYVSVYSGGTLTGVSVNSSGYVSVYSGGSAQSATVNSGGSLYVTEGAKATEIIENGGYVSVSSGAKAKFRANTFDGVVLDDTGATVHSGTTANNTTINYGALMYVSSGGKANGAKVNSGGGLIVIEGGALNNATVNSNGSMFVSGSAGGVTVNTGGYLQINGNAKATEIRENGGYVSVGSASVKFKANTISGLTIESNAATAHSGTTVNKLTLNTGGSMYVYGGKVNDATLNQRYAALRVASGGKATGVTLNSSSCSMYVSNGGTADKIKIRGGGYLAVSSGGKATNVDWTPCEGRVFVESGATVKFVSKYSGVYFGSGGKLLSSAGTMNGKTLDQGYEMNVINGGTAENTTLNSGGSLYVYSGGTAENTTVNSYGQMYVSKGGTADNTTVNSSGRIGIASGGAANGITVSSGGSMTVYWSGLAKDIVFSGVYMDVNSGGTAGHVTVTDGLLIVFSAAKVTNIVWNPCEGSVVVSSGGTASFASKYSGVYFGSGNKLLSHAETMDGKSLGENYEMNVMSGGIANDTAVNSGGSMFIYSGGTANNTEVNSSGRIYVSSGAAIINTTVNESGYLYVFSGAMADGITVNDHGEARIMKAANVTVNSGGIIRLEISGTIDNLTVNEGGSANVNGKTVMNNAAVNAGKLYAGTVNDLAVNSGGTARVECVNTAMVNSGGSMVVSSGGSGVTIDGGVVSVVSGALSDTTIYSNGTMVVEKSAYGVSVYSGGSLYVSYGGMADSATVYNSGEMTVRGSASNVTVQTGGSMTASDGDLFGSMTFATGAVVSMDDYTTVHFDIADLTPDECQLPFVNNISVISGTPRYRINLSAIQDFGTYTLAGGAAGFSGSVYCTTEDDTGWSTDYTLTVGDTVDIYGAGHTLNLNGDMLTLTVGMAADPVDPDDGGWNDYLYNKSTKTLNESVYDLKPKTINEESKEIVVDETGTIRNGGMHNFIGESDVSGRIDSADFTKIQLDSAAKLSFTITATNAMKFTVWSLTEGTDKKGNDTYTMKALQTVTAKNGWVDTCKKPLLLEAGEYYVSMELANPKKPGTGYYSVQIDDFDGHSEFYTKADNYDDWDDMKERGSSGGVGNVGTLSEDTWEILSGEWVGFSDTVDYNKFKIESAACLRFYLDATDATKFTIWQLNEKTDKNGKTTYSLKSLQATTLKKEGDGFYFADTKDLILDAGTYYFSMESTNAKKGGSATYNVMLSGALFYTQANNNDDWTDMKTDGEFGLVENVGVLDSGMESVVNDWVGYSDAIDYKKFTLSRKTSLSFRVSAENATKFTVWQLNEKTDKKGNTTYSLKSLDSVKLKEFEEIETRTLSLSAGTYYFSMESTNAKKGGSAFYNVNIGTFVEADSLSAAPAMTEMDLTAGLSFGQSGADMLADASAFDKLASDDGTSTWLNAVKLA